jgi:hypothetical protein
VPAIVRRTLVLVAAGAVVGVSAFFAFELARSLSGKASARPDASSEVVVVQSAAPVGPSVHVGMRAAIRDAIDKARAVSAPELDAFLAGLEAQARRRGAVTAVDIEPGLAKCFELGQHEKAAQFGERMSALQRELGGKPPEPPAPPVAESPRLDALFLDIQKSEGEKRQKLVREYVRAIETLPEVEQVERVRKLNEVAGRKDERSDPATLDALYQGIERATDPEERQALIREYVALVDALPEEQGRARLEVLNRRFGKPSSVAPKTQAEPP